MAISIPLQITEYGGVDRAGEGIHSGIPLAKATIQSLEELELVDEQRRVVPAQFETLSLWPDGSQRWVLVNLTEPLDAKASRRYTLQSRSDNSQSSAPPQSVTVTDRDDVFTVDTGRVRFDVP